MSGQPKPMFYIVLGLVILGLIGLAVSRTGSGGKAQPKGETISQEELAGAGLGAEADDTGGITTVKEYEFVPQQRLPEVKGVSNYKALKDRTVRFAINVWAGWAPIVYANDGFAPGKTWTAPDGQPFKLELVLIDNPVAMRDAYAAGEVQIGWATLDMVPLFLDSLQRDSRVMPRIYQQVDWSNGGDGIVVRDTIKTMSDLRGKTIVLAQNSPSEFFVLNALINSGVQPSEVTFKYTEDAFQAAAAFNADKKIAACVSWAPDIYNLADVAGNKLIVSTQTANKLIADVWFARADFAKDHPDIIEGLTRGIFDGMMALEKDTEKQKVARLLATGFGIPETDAFAMLADAHSTNFAENKDFFINQNNPTNFERTWNTAYFLYRKIGKVGTPVPFDQVMDFSVLKKLEKDPKYANSKNTYGMQFVPASAATIQAESEEILTKTVTIHFYPNSWDLHKKVMQEVNGSQQEQLYDPNVDLILEEVGKLAGQYGAARIVIEGHGDASLKGRVPDSLVKELSSNRANAVKEQIIKKFPSLQPNQFASTGLGWDRPFDESDPLNHAKNRRVEIKVYPAEAPAG